MATIAEQLAAFAVGPAPAAAPDDVRAAARLRVLDAAGCALAANALGEADALKKTPGVFLRGPSLALLGGALAHGLDFDDTHPPSVCHVSAVTAPAAYAVSPEDDAGFLDAYLAGCEVTTRLGMAAAGDFHRRGLHPTSVCGVFGATASAARRLGLDAEQTTSALGLAGSRAAGVLACLAEGAPVKPLHAGWAARDGVECALLAQAGAIGPRGVLEGHQGLFPALLGDPHAEALAAQTADLGTRWETPAIAIKALPVCHFLHGALEAVAELPLDPTDEFTIEVAIDDAGWDLVAEPIAAKQAPTSTYAARFALHWCVAASIVHGRLTPELLRDALDDPAVLALAQRVTATTLPRGGTRSTFAGRVSVGERSATVEHPLGSDGAPMSEDGIRAKFRANTALARGAEQVATLEARIDAL